MNPTFLAGLLSLETYHSYKKFSGQQLLDIWLGNDEQYKSLSHVHAQVILLYLGFAEMKNACQSDVVEHLMISSSGDADSRVWLYYKGSRADLLQTYPRLLTRANELGYDVLELPFAIVTPGTDHSTSASAHGRPSTVTSAYGKGSL
jgi:hypothetical protein